MCLCWRVDWGGLMEVEKGDRGKKVQIELASPQPMLIPCLSWFLHSSQSHESIPLVSQVMTLRACLWTLTRQKVGGGYSLLIGWDIVSWLGSYSQHSMVWSSFRYLFLMRRHKLSVLKVRLLVDHGRASICLYYCEYLKPKMFTSKQPIFLSQYIHTIFKKFLFKHR